MFDFTLASFMSPATKRKLVLDGDSSSKCKKKMCNDYVLVTQLFYNSIAFFFLIGI